MVMNEFENFISIVRRLRKECPWDSVQTHESLRPHLIEEAYEAADSIQQNNLQELKGELGDLLLHIVLHSIIAEETNTFTVEEIIHSITEKMIRRHPHIFGDAVIRSAEEQLISWEKIKMNEGRNSVLDGIPQTLPALIKAEKIQKKAAKVGFDWDNKNDVWNKVEEELQEFKKAQHDNSDATMREEFGDLLFALVNYARFLNINCEDALNNTTKKFTARFHYIEEQFRNSGRDIHSSTLQEMDGYWNEAKEKLDKK